MEPRDHFADITTPRGSHVFLQGLTEAQAAAVTAQFAQPDAPEDATVNEWADKKQCDRCQGAGGWHETVETPTAGGGTVVTKKWVNCRPCKGSGEVEDK
ncbi:hypothetical protein [Nonomuraea sp. NPDC048901]|uniref:hypothetical protein n=1 Tax=Nonomuraea sp. NPDC048901 TaxID=3155627 RepID=UPI0033EF30C8